MLLNFRIERAKKKLDKCVEKYGLKDERTIKQSGKVDRLINKYYKQ